MATKDKLINLEDLKVLSDHVEGEVTDLKSDIDYGLMHDFVNWQQGALSTTGTETINSNVVRTDFIDVDSFVSLYKPVGVWNRICYYDSSKTFIEQESSSYNIAYTYDRNYIKTNHPTAKYVRFALSIYEGSTQQPTNPTNILDTGYVFKLLRSVDEINSTVSELSADVSELSADIHELESEVSAMEPTANNALEQGTIASTTGKPSSNSARVRTADFIDIDSFYSAYAPINWQVLVFGYTTNDVSGYLGSATLIFKTSGTRTKTKENVLSALSSYQNVKYIKFVIQNSDGTTITVSDVEAAGIYFNSIANLSKISETVSALNDNLYVEDLTLTNETKVFTIPSGRNRIKNSIITVFAMYTQADGVTDTPYISASRSWLGSDNGYHEYYGSGRYELGQNGNYKQSQIRLAPLMQSTKETKINVVVPEGVTLHIKYLSLDCSDMISREDNGIHLNAHGQSGFGGPPQTNIQWEMAARLGYQYCITIPKVTSDGVYVCLHDDDSIQATARNDDGSQIASEYRDRPVSDFTYNQLLQFDFGIVRGRPFSGERIPLLEDFFKTCAKTGMHPMLSVHPSLSGHWDNIKALAKKYGVLNKLNIKSDPTSIEVPMAVLLDDIESYTIDDSTGESRVARFNTLTERYTLNNARKVIEYNYSVLTDALISDVLSNGYLCGCFNYGSDSRIVKTLMDKGVTEFTEDYNCSVGLNW